MLESRPPHPASEDALLNAPEMLDQAAGAGAEPLFLPRGELASLLDALGADGRTGSRWRLRR